MPTPDERPVPWAIKLIAGVIIALAFLIAVFLLLGLLRAAIGFAFG